MAAVRPRAIWTGSISFGLVNAPVRMYSAVSEKNLKFNLIHEKDGGRIGYQQFCKLEDEVVPRDEIVKAYEVEEGEFVYMHDEDFEAAAPDSYKTITIQDFVPAEEIDPIYFERTYYLGPADRSGEPVYALLVRAMEDAGLVAVATYVFHDRENLGCIRARDGVLTLEKMFFADEVRAAEGIAPDSVPVEDRQLEMAMQLIRQYEGRFDPEKYHDEYRERLLGVIEAKRSGEGVKAAPAPEKTAAPDLLAALQASLDEARKDRPEPAAKPKGGGRKKAATAAAGGGREAAPRRRRSS
jgi:DNA end-binding protein Ku